MVVMFALGGYAWVEHQEKITIQAQYDGFVAKAQAIAAAQLAANARKEKQYAEKLHAAESDRDTAVGRLRDYQANTNRLRVSVTPKAPQGTDRVCFTRSKLDAAIQQLITEVQGLLATGDSSLIANREALQAWPD